MLQIALLSFWHVHAMDYLKEVEEHPGTQLAAVWDEDPQRGQREADRRGVPFFNGLDELLAQPQIDGVIVTTPTTMHHEVLRAAAQAGKHIFTEKVLAPTFGEVQDILAAVEQVGVTLTVSLPRLYAGYTEAISEIIDNGLLGDLTQVRVRVSHDGALRTAHNPEGWLPAPFFDPAYSAGGVLIDFGCHPMYLTRHFLGMPESVSATYGYVTDRAVEDNAVVTLRYPNGAIGIVEAGFVNRFSPFTIEVHGTMGSVLFGTPDARLLLRSAQVEDGEHWVVKHDLPADRRSPFARWVTHIQQGTSATENVAAAVDLTILMEAANRSAAHHQPARVDSIVSGT
jgi:1,5-anhydro-D-fructose reductase (1,5-anhydro-D-mannitol-forming)